jgi:hypothetical protein
MKASSLSLIVVLGCTVAVAQGANPYDGSWRAHLETDKGEMREGDVTISGQGGSWDFLHQVRGNPCAGRAYPLTVQSATGEELAVTIERAKTLAGCKDGTAKFKRVSDTVLEGEFENGRKIKLVRK